MNRLLRELIAYGVASGVALAADVGLLLLLTQRAGWDYRPASILSFVTGATVAYALSVSFVFSSHRVRNRTPSSVFRDAGTGRAGSQLAGDLFRGGDAGLKIVMAKAIAAACHLRNQLHAAPTVSLQSGSAGLMSRIAVIVGAGPAGLTSALELLRGSDVVPLVIRGRRAGRRHIQDRQLPRQPHGSGWSPVFLEVRLGDGLVAVYIAGGGR